MKIILFIWLLSTIIDIAVLSTVFSRDNIKLDASSIIIVLFAAPIILLAIVLSLFIGKDDD